MRGAALVEVGGVYRGPAPVSKGGESRLPDHRSGPGADRDAPLAQRRPSYPLVGRSPAEPAAVSPGGRAVPQPGSGPKSKPSPEASSGRVPATRAGRVGAKERSFFVQTMGSTSVLASPQLAAVRAGRFL